jgi:hypothetical protein
MVRMLMLLVPLSVPLLMSGAAGAEPASGGRGEAVAQVPGVVVFFGHGEQLFVVGPLPELGRDGKLKVQEKSEADRKKAGKKGKKGKKAKAKIKKKRRTHGEWLDGYQAAYRCQVLSIFWSYVHRWGCKPAVAQGDTYLRSAMSDHTRGA